MVGEVKYFSGGNELLSISERDAIPPNQGEDFKLSSGFKRDQ